MNEVWLNGNFVDESAGVVSLRDTGLLHGAGVFTTMRADEGRVFRLDQHLQRLRRSCDALFIPLQYTDEILRDAVHQLLQKNQAPDARLRLTVTRGAAQQDPLHGLRLTPNVFLTATLLEPYPADYYDRGLTVIVLDEQKINPYDLQAGHKTLNYFSRLSALRAANQRGAGEAIWFTVQNFAQSGSISNLFIVRDGHLFTPPTPVEMQDEAVACEIPYEKSAVLPGIIRQAVIEAAAAEKIPARLAGLTIEDLLEADEMFVTNSIMRVMPVCRVERRAIGSEKPGPITLRLREMIEEQARH